MANSDYTVSVIIVVFDRTHYIEDAINSVLNQTFLPIEIIIVVNGGTEEVINKLKELSLKSELIKVVNTAEEKHQKIANNYLSTSRNIGIRAAKGNWIAFLDDDDIWLPHKLERQISVAKTENYDLIACNIIHFSEDGDILDSGAAEIPTGVNWLDALTIGNYFAGGSSALVSKNILLTVGMFDERMNSAEDHDLWWRSAQITERFFIVKEILVKYRISGNRMTNNLFHMLTGEAFLLSKMLENRKFLNEACLRERVRHIRDRLNDLLSDDLHKSYDESKLTSMPLSKWEEINSIFSEFKYLKSIEKYIRMKRKKLFHLLK